MSLFSCTWPSYSSYMWSDQSFAFPCKVLLVTQLLIFSMYTGGFLIGHQVTVVSHNGQNPNPNPTWVHKHNLKLSQSAIQPFCHWVSSFIIHLATLSYILVTHLFLLNNWFVSYLSFTSSYHEYLLNLLNTHWLLNCS